MFELLVAGIVAGIATKYAGEQRWFEGVELLGVPLVAGIVYAVIVGGWLVVRGPGRSPAIVLWAALVVVAWVAAVRAGLATAGASDLPSFLPSGRGAWALAGGIAGLVGASIVAGAGAVLLPATRSLRAFAMVAAVGAVAGLSIAVTDEAWPLFIVWQGAVAGATGYVADED